MPRSRGAATEWLRTGDEEREDDGLMRERRDPSASGCRSRENGSREAGDEYSASESQRRRSIVQLATAVVPPVTDVAE